MNENEQLRQYEQIVRSSRDPWEVQYYNDQAALIRERIDLEEGLWSDLFEMATDRKRAGELTSIIANSYTDKHQRISRLASALYAEKLITQEQYNTVKSWLSSSTPTQLQNMKQNQLERERLDEIMKRVYKAVGPANKREALAVYNEIGGARGEDKLRRWLTKLVEVKLLPVTFSRLLQYPDWLQKIILPGEDKERLPEANK